MCSLCIYNHMDDFTTCPLLIIICMLTLFGRFDIAISIIGLFLVCWGFFLPRQLGPSPVPISLKHRGELNPALAEYRSSALASPHPPTTPDLSTPSGKGVGETFRPPRQPMATPLNRGGQSSLAKPQKLVQVSDEDDIKSRVQDIAISGHVKSELGHPELGHGEMAGQSTPPSALGPNKVSTSTEESRKLRQAQQKLRKEQWKKKYGSVAGGVGVGSVPDSDLVAEMKKYEEELISNGTYLANDIAMHIVYSA